MFRKQLTYSHNKDKYNSFSQEIEQAVPANSYVLDIGCATGKLARALKLKQCRVVGIDIDDNSLSKAAKYCQKTHKVDVDKLSDLDKELNGERFDVITLGDILEHLKYPGVLLFHLRKYLKPNGSIISSIPNSAFIWMRIKFLLGNFNYSKTGGLMDEDHLRFFSFSTAKLLFEDAGYSVQNLEASSHGIVKSRYAFIKYFAKLVPSLFAIHIIITATPNKEMVKQHHTRTK